MMNDLEKGWIAGIIDGEGSLLISKHKNKNQTWIYIPSLQIRNTDKKMIEKIYSITNLGSIYKEKRDSPRKDEWIIKFFPNQIRILLPKLIDTLVTKQSQGKLLLEFLNLYSMKTRGKRTELEDERIKEIFNTLKSLNCRKGKRV